MKKHTFPKTIVLSVIILFLVFGPVLAFDLDEFPGSVFCDRDMVFSFDLFGSIDMAPRIFAYRSDPDLVVVKQFILYIERQEKSPPGLIQPVF